jgi:hypothetical protein
MATLRILQNYGVNHTTSYPIPHIATVSWFTFFTYFSSFGCWAQLDIMRCLYVSGIDHIYQRPIGIVFPTHTQTIILWFYDEDMIKISFGVECIIFISTKSTIGIINNDKIASLWKYAILFYSLIDLNWQTCL